MVAIQRETVRLRQSRATRWSAIAAELAGAVAGQRGDHAAAAVDPPHAPVQPIGDVDVASAIDDDAVRLVHLRLCRRTAVAGEAAFTGAGNRGDDAGARIDAADAVIVGIGKAQIAAGIEREIERIVQQRLRRRATIAGIALRARSRDSADDPLRVCHRSYPSRCGHHGCRNRPVKRRISQQVAGGYRRWTCRSTAPRARSTPSWKSGSWRATRWAPARSITISCAPGVR